MHPKATPTDTVRLLIRTLHRRNTRKQVCVSTNHKRCDHLCMVFCVTTSAITRESQLGDRHAVFTYVALSSPLPPSKLLFFTVTIFLDKDDLSEEMKEFVAVQLFGIQIILGESATADFDATVAYDTVCQVRDRWVQGS